jgi:hypothetical protein
MRTAARLAKDAAGVKKLIAASRAIAPGYLPNRAGDRWTLASSLALVLRSGA